jgi:hypothetical protein
MNYIQTNEQTDGNGLYSTTRAHFVVVAKSSGLRHATNMLFAITTNLSGNI